MRADLKFVTDRFNTFNASVFGGQLPTPQFAIVTARTFAGRFTYRIKRGSLGTRHAYDPCLRISRCFDMPQNEIEDIILHEMIHYYIFHKRITDNAPHGRQFRHIMQKINALHGRNITISARIDRSTGSTDTRVRQHLICLMTDSDGADLIMVCARSCFADVYRSLNRTPLITGMRWFTSSDTFFNRYPRSRRPCGYKISADDIRMHLLTARELRIITDSHGYPVKITAKNH